MADIALVMCDDYHNKAENRKDYSPSTLHYLKGAFDRYGLETRVFNPYSTGQDLESLAKDIKDSGVKAIGISAASTDTIMQSLREMSKAFGELGLPIIIGGYCSIYENVLDELPHVNAVVLGEGEVSGPLVFERYINGELPHDIQGVKYRDGDKVIYTGPAQQIKNLDDITPDFGLVKVEKDGSRSATLYSSRGCYNKCSFCDIWRIQGKGIRAESTEKMIKDITTLARSHYIDRISYHDDDFLFKKGRLDGIAETLRKYNIQISFETRANDLLRPEIQEEILRNKDVISTINVGVESFSDSQLERWCKNVTAQQNMDALRFLVLNEIRIKPFLIFSDEHTTTEELRENVYGLIKIRGHPYITLFDKEERIHLKELMNPAGQSFSPEFARLFTDLVHNAKYKLRLREMAYNSIEWDDNLLAGAAVNGGATLLLTSYLIAVNHKSVENASEKIRKRAREIYRETLNSLRLVESFMNDQTESASIARKKIVDNITDLGMESVSMCPWYDIEEVLTSWGHYDKVDE